MPLRMDLDPILIQMATGTLEIGLIIELRALVFILTQMVRAINIKETGKTSKNMVLERSSF